MDSLPGSSGYAFGWNKIVESLTGWDPGKEFLPAIPAAIVIYMSVYLIGLLLHTVTRMIVPSPVRGYVLDFVKTMTVCGYPFGHGMMRKYYGEPGYMCAMVPTMFLTFSTLRAGDGNPINVWLQYYKRNIPLWKCIVKTIIQIIAGFAAYRVGMYILSLELHPMYVARLKEYHSEFCSSDLTVPAYVGFLVEFCAVIYDCWFANQTFTGNLHIDTIIKILNSGLLVVSGVHLTGMYIHPAMASGHTWGCGDTSGISHILLYWVGPIIGTWISFQLQKRFSLRRKSSKASKSRSSGSSQSDKQHVNGTMAVNGQGVHLTGMYIHPAMASGHTWGCGDTSGISHILLYWVGPIIGTWISFQLQKRFSLRRKSSKASKSRSSGSSQSDKQHVNGTMAVNGQGKKQRNGKRKFYNN